MPTDIERLVIQLLEEPCPDSPTGTHNAEWNNPLRRTCPCIVRFRFKASQMRQLTLFEGREQ